MPNPVRVPEPADAAELAEGSEVLAEVEEDEEGRKPFLSTEARHSPLHLELPLRKRNPDSRR